MSLNGRCSSLLDPEGNARLVRVITQIGQLTRNASTALRPTTTDPDATTPSFSRRIFAITPRYGRNSDSLARTTRLTSSSPLSSSFRTPSTRFRISDSLASCALTRAWSAFDSEVTAVFFFAASDSRSSASHFWMSASLPFPGALDDAAPFFAAARTAIIEYQYPYDNNVRGRITPSTQSTPSGVRQIAMSSSLKLRSFDESRVSRMRATKRGRKSVGWMPVKVVTADILASSVCAVLSAYHHKYGSPAHLVRVQYERE